MVYVCQLAFALVFQSIPPILRLIVSEMNISHAQAGLLMSLFASPGIFIAIPAGILSDRVGLRKLGLVSLLLMIIGTFILGMSGGFLLMSVGRVVSGIGALTLAIILPPLLSGWFTHGGLGLAMGIFNTGMPLGILASFDVIGIIGISMG